MEWLGTRPNPLANPRAIVVSHGGQGKNQDRVIHTREDRNLKPLSLKDTGANRNRRFTKMDKPKDQRWLSHGSGVVYEPARGLSMRQYLRLQADQRNHAVLHATHTQEVAPIVEPSKLSKRMAKLKARRIG